MKPLFKDRICAVIAAETWPGVDRLLKIALPQTSTVEFRLDWLAGRSHETRCLPRLSAKTIIATCRHREHGGRFSGNWRQQLAILNHAIADKSDWCDVELDLLHRFESLRPLGRTRVLASHHDFGRTPDVAALRQRMARWKPDAIKIATHCNSIRDSLRMLALCKGRPDVIAVPMGEIGLPARVLALKHGSALAYASVGEKTAPGQLTLDEMKNLYRADRLDKHTRVYGVIGNPVSHSLSPLLHNTGFIANRTNDVYLPFLVRDLRDFLAAIKPLGIRGFSVTVPWKEKILRHLDDCDPLAAAIGAVNTVVVRKNGQLYGMNTDYVGVLRALQERVRLRGARVLIYGAGGVARAVAFALAHEGAVPAICARRPSQARQLARAVRCESLDRRALRTEYFDAIVNCTPVGMHPRVTESPLRADELNCRLVFDTVYRPERTKLLQLAARRRIETISGVEMFLAQGIAQWEIWTEQRAPEKQMRAAIMTALRDGK